MLTDREASHLVLAYIEQASSEREAYAVQSCCLSEQEDYWVVRANSADYVLRGDASRCYVGVKAYLVDARTGAIEIVGSGQSVDSYLQDKYDLREAAGRHYVLHADFPPSDKRAIVRLRQVLECTVQRARELSEGGRPWLTGVRADLLRAQELFRQREVATSIALVDEPLDARLMSGRILFWDPLRKVLRD